MRPVCRAMPCNCCMARARRWARRWWRCRRSPAWSSPAPPRWPRSSSARWPPRRPHHPLIAETGGINAMLVDSTALPEQVADAVVQSAFRSAGQRCSALRLLCVHEAVADGVIAMIQGAAQELVVGDPRAAEHRCGACDRQGSLRWHTEPPAAPAGPGQAAACAGGAVPRWCIKPPDRASHVRACSHRRRAARDLRAGVAGGALGWRPAGGGRADQRAGLWPDLGPADPHRFAAQALAAQAVSAMCT